MRVLLNKMASPTTLPTVLWGRLGCFVGDVERAQNLEMEVNRRWLEGKIPITTKDTGEAHAKKNGCSVGCRTHRMVRTLAPRAAILLSNCAISRWIHGRALDSY